MMDVTLTSVLIIAYFITLSGGQTCVNNPNVNQRGDVSIDSGRNVAVSMSNWYGSDFPLFQVWHPTSLNSTVYNKIGEIKLPAGDFVPVGVNRNYYSASVSLNSTNQIEFQSGDVIGYFEPSNPRRLIGSIQTSGYTSYSNSVTTPLTSIDTNNVDNTETNCQPLFAVTFDIQCNNPANGNVSCTSSRTGVGYEGDTCSFTCNTGYELTGSDTRTCQSDGSWSGSDTVCRKAVPSTVTTSIASIATTSTGTIAILATTRTLSTAATFITATSILSPITISSTTATTTTTDAIDVTDEASSSSDVNFVVIVVPIIIIIVIALAIVVALIFYCRRRNKKLHSIYETMLQSSSTTKLKPVHIKTSNGQDSKESEYTEICKNTYSTEQAEKVPNPTYSISFEHQDKHYIGDNVSMQDNPAYSIPSECQVEMQRNPFSFATKQ